MVKDISREEVLGTTGELEIIIDPRMGSASYLKSEGTSNIISDLQEANINVYPAEGLHIDDGLQAINSLLSYDSTKPIDALNHPCLLYTSPSPRDRQKSRMPSSA